MPRERTCYMCDALASPGPGEHVPPKCIFPSNPDYRKQLITVPSCPEHNINKSADDQLLCSHLVSFEGNNELALEVLEERVMPALEHPVRPYPVTKFYSQLRPVWINFQETGVFKLDLKRFYAGIECIARGLFYSETGEKLRDSLTVMSGAQKASDLSVSPWLPLISKYEALLPPAYKGANPRVFQYAFHYFQGDGCWMGRLRFYEGLPIYVYWLPKNQLTLAEIGARHKFGICGRPEQLIEQCKTELRTELEVVARLAKVEWNQLRKFAVSLVGARFFQGKKKGADTGIDGLKFFRDLDKKEVRKIIVSVKGGENVSPTMVKDLIATIARDKAEIGLFLTLTEPTKAMSTEAVAAGFYEGASGTKYPRLQILTIESLLAGTARPEHPDYEPDLNFKKAKAESTEQQVRLGL